MTSVERLICDSRIDGVVVYARGAIVTRRVVLPAELPSGQVDLVISGVTPLAEAGSFTASVDGDREVVGLRSSVELPDEPALPGDLRQRVIALERKGERLRAMKKLMSEYRARVAEISVQPSAPPRRRRRSPLWLDAAVAASNLVLDLVEHDDVSLHALDLEIEENDRELIAAQLEARQSPSQELLGSSQWAREATVRLAAGEGTLSALTVSYTVGSARWWPAYSARLSEGGKTAELSVEGFVCQATGESWDDVELSLCTADINQDLELPELQSLRLGRRQPPKSTGYRPAPAGLDELFADYDRAVTGDYPPAPNEPMSGTVVLSVGDSEYAKHERRDELAADFPVDTMEDMDLEEVTFATSLAAEGFAGGGVEAAPAPMRAMAPAGMAQGLAPESMQRKRKAVERGAAAAAYGKAEPQGIAPEETWRNFDRLVLGEPTGPRRGRLSPRHETTLDNQTATALRIVESAPQPPHVRDPRRSRGDFDYRYDAEGLVRVKSNGLPERVELTRGTAEATTRFRVVPSVEEAAYREVHLTNPTPSPLLAGPVDVFVDGALVTTSVIESVDRGGHVTFGLGVEERLRVARNSSALESSKGLLKGTTMVVHEVEIDLRSSLGFDADISVVERVPATDDTEIQVEILSANPPGVPYDQADRSAPIRGGIIWELKLPAGERTTVRHSYALSLPAKFEIVGGNRRD